jgi:hypothetical protein
LFCVEACAASRFGNDFATEFWRGKTRQAALEFADGRAHCGKNNGSFHLEPPKYLL